MAVQVHAAGVTLHADLVVPQDAAGLVIFAHGSGSGRHSSRNRAVASSLQHANLATLLVDLLTESEERQDTVSAEYRFDIGLLAARTVGVVDWAGQHESASALPVGIFGASTGAAAALMAAATRPRAVRAVVSRGGRPDLAGPSLDFVAAPTLLVVGSRDEAVLALNREALARLKGPKRLEIVEGATHLFEEHGALDRVAELAREWFVKNLK
jgi:pimeloyl-ACP methyl ester carboxylesterase